MDAWNCPVSAERVTATADVATLAHDAQVLDVGCGGGGLLAALGRPGVGIDIDADAVDAARARCPQVQFEVRDAATGLPRGFHLAACLGATHAFGKGAGALPAACTALRDAVMPGGWVLLGELHTTRPIPPGYARVLGDTSALERGHADVIAAVESTGLQCEHAITATQAEWDDFEWRFYRRHRDAVWRDAYLRWGRTTLGYSLVLARRP